ncbi:sulfate adenylyltransferase subunit 1 [Streptomyces kronopolitis]|uniref:sulfate adenylyltransferase subunit 1 n=1 Tax=Streptomyces kronopolitis TaxID=1612435 RepID=UPI0036AC2334
MTTPDATSLLSFATAGSVDDGKSTLVGRLLCDTRSVHTDQLADIERASRDRDGTEPDLALFSDGLRAEREQGITIDVAYRYFSTPRRRFVLADTPGHVQYTRNMVTGVSHADLVVILADARNGVVEQTLRHVAISALLRVPQLVLAVNKMDLVDWDERTFSGIVRNFTEHAASLGAREVTAIPISALTGDNVVSPSSRMAWDRGPSLLSHLQTTPARPDLSKGPTRFPVQYVLRSGTTTCPQRGYAGRIASGRFRVGEAVTVLPSGQCTTIDAIDVLGKPVDIARAPLSVTLRLAGQLDVPRGDLIVSGHDVPSTTREVRATVCHLHDHPLRPGDRLLLKHGSRTVRALVTEIIDRLDTATLEQHSGSGELRANDIGTVLLRTSEPLALDVYAHSPHTGSFALIEPVRGDTYSAGLCWRQLKISAQRSRGSSGLGNRLSASP